MDQRANNCPCVALNAGLATASFAADATESLDASTPVMGECHRNSPIIKGRQWAVSLRLALSGLHCDHLSCTHTPKAADMSAMSPACHLVEAEREIQHRN